MSGEARIAGGGLHAEVSGVGCHWGRVASGGGKRAWVQLPGWTASENPRPRCQPAGASGPRPCSLSAGTTPCDLLLSLLTLPIKLTSLVHRAIHVLILLPALAAHPNLVPAPAPGFLRARVQSGGTLHVRGAKLAAAGAAAECKLQQLTQLPKRPHSRGQNVHHAGPRPQVGPGEHQRRSVLEPFYRELPASSIHLELRQTLGGCGPTGR